MFLNQIGEYWNSRAQGYSDTINEQFEGEVYTYYRKYLKNCAPKGEKLNCVDMGCGPGYFSILLSKMGHNVVAFDFSDGMLEKARENFKAMDVSPTIKQGDVQNPQFEDESIDYIVSRNLIWNLEEPQKAYKEWVRILKPGGRILIFDANHYLHYFDEDYKKAREAIKNKDDRHEHMNGVDPTPINDIARELPLSKEHRPQWDINKMLSLGMDNLKVSVHRKNVDDNDNSKRIIGDFVLCAEKPVY